MELIIETGLTGCQTDMCSSITAKAMGFTFSSLDVASDQHMPFGKPQFMYHGLLFNDTSMCM